MSERAQVDASADAGTATCHDEDAIKMFPSQQTACRKNDVLWLIMQLYANICKIILHIGCPYVRLTFFFQGF